MYSYIVPAAPKGAGSRVFRLRPVGTSHRAARRRRRYRPSATAGVGSLHAHAPRRTVPVGARPKRRCAVLGDDGAPASIPVTHAKAGILRGDDGLSSLHYPGSRSQSSGSHTANGGFPSPTPPRPGCTHEVQLASHRRPRPVAPVAVPARRVFRGAHHRRPGRTGAGPAEIVGTFTVTVRVIITEVIAWHHTS